MLVIQTVVVLAGAGLAAAQSLSVSSNCQNTLKGLIASPDAACLNPSAILSFVVGAEKSITKTIDTWLSGVCSQGSCTDATLQSVVQNITSGCAQDLGSAPVDQIVSIVQKAYPTVRKMVCLKDDKTNNLCVSDTFSAVEQVIGTLQISDLSFLNIIDDAKKLITTGIKDLACTDCTKAAYTLARSEFPDIVSDINDEATALCGASFVDGSSPSGISESAASGVFAASKGNSASGSFAPSSSLAAGIVVVSVVGLFL